MTTWILYGANGYTGELIAREASRRGLRPILAGRDGPRVSRLAVELGCPARVFALSDVADIVRHLAGAQLLLNCAGPFSATAVPLLEACLLAGVDYLDITGEIDVIEAAAALNERAKQAGIVLIPAVGFDVVPSDCLAALLAAQLPSATHLQLAFTALGKLSPGTIKTTLENLPKGGRVRINGHITRVPLAWKTREVPFAKGSKTAVTIPWGDVASAYYSTGIGNIEVYTTVPAEQLRLLRRWGWLLPLLRWGPLLRYLQRRVERTIRGPTAGDRAAGWASLWGRVEDATGKSVEATLITPSGYDLTTLTGLASVERVLAGNVPPGFHTPSRAFGREFMLSIPGTDYRKVRVKLS
jgi:short subunit dehydrogenase-like uncharacterized protein